MLRIIQLQPETVNISIVRDRKFFFKHSKLRKWMFPLSSFLSFKFLPIIARHIRHDFHFHVWIIFICVNNNKWLSYDCLDSPSSNYRGGARGGGGGNCPPMIFFFCLSAQRSVGHDSTPTPLWICFGKNFWSRKKNVSEPPPPPPPPLSDFFRAGAKLLWLAQQ